MDRSVLEEINTHMVLELAIAGYLSCNLILQRIEGEDKQCFYKCSDTSKEFASTLKQFQCPRRLYVDRPPIPFKDREKK